MHSPLCAPPLCTAPALRLRPHHYALPPASHCASPVLPQALRKLEEPKALVRCRQVDQQLVKDSISAAQVSWRGAA